MRGTTNDWWIPVDKGPTTEKRFDVMTSPWLPGMTGGTESKFAARLPNLSSCLSWTHVKMGKMATISFGGKTIVKKPIYLFCLKTWYLTVKCNDLNQCIQMYKVVVICLYTYKVIYKWWWGMNVHWKCHTILYNTFNILRPRQNGRHFADDFFIYTLLSEDVWISQNFVPNGPINNIPALIQIMACRRPGDKPLSEPMMVSLLTHKRVTRPQWVNHFSCSNLCRKH